MHLKKDRVIGFQLYFSQQFAAKRQYVTTRVFNDGKPFQYRILTLDARHHVLHHR